ncbi:serine--tRNA ligase 2 [Thermoclostridium stercorarium subsp. stercorarium DSM 8532]|jgi:seryl-tRNA synthetase|uniref:Serine--tRNA ligase n=3 Tax=Thermoclostridium stercorarium TaxID=1510 RepID=L7VKN3_THES1|nr:serine--tRNA ligase [Thermoclostridium stercorarium]AGC67046.1 serine--tRNA ligase 2 [Thermoclostridium stercorarium subsp. stercorarium DSM 8532]AGI38132.1 seryl-tRNA synthetase [Thermoclostridium stercorarium subsp. stercorarium DSM 8532]ANW97541.1 serine--tRNA ligase [Thermoclostridium stercorarium subsp. thermolacticum DSM 2910]ANX00101.1 serine--tRNA ligase [Thermoclostridium stercorarium subsp. leptospartum DSM 9219]UZQ85659.1 serine--tRNA ligase [Thermoclostridium stercorarium]
MLDINRIRNNPEEVRRALLKRMDNVDFTELLEWDKQRRQLIASNDEKKAKRNKVSDEIPRLKKEGKDISGLLSEMKLLSDDIKKADDEIKELEKKINNFLSSLPNIPADDVEPGGKENNKVIRTWGEKPVFNFKPKNHVDLATDLGLVDYERGARIGGSGYWVYTGLGAVLEWALLNYFIEEHLKDGYIFMLPPHILTYKCGYTAGQFPKFVDDVFKVEASEPSEDMHFLLPTAETALINFHRDEILNEEDLPRKYFAYTPCYRKEAGSYRAEERGMIRGHQFNKVEMFQYTTPETSEKALEELVNKAERLVQGLGLHHRVTKLAAKDCSASMGKTFDIEVWIPSMNDYKEVSSASNAYDYQARRGNIRFRRSDTGKTEFVHTLNASGLATSRIIPAILEQFQQEDGSVVVPEVLRKWVGTDVIRKPEKKI